MQAVVEQKKITLPAFGSIPKKKFWARVRKDLYTYRYAYLMLFPALLWYGIFVYWPLAGNVIAFMNFTPARGIWDSEWVGLTHFISFTNSFFFWRLIRNTVLLSFYGVIFAFPIPIILAIMLNEVPFIKYRRTVQTITYMPFFISLIVFCGIVIDFMRIDGVVTSILHFFGAPNQNWMMRPGAFRTIFITSDIWRTMGWNSIIFLAALSTIDQELFEAARIDGAGRLRQIFHITLPGILPITMILLIIRLGAILNVGFEQVLLLQNDANLYTADVISTFIYRRGILAADFSFATAVGLFNSSISFALVIAANWLSRKVTGHSLW